MPREIKKNMYQAASLTGDLGEATLDERKGRFRHQQSGGCVRDRHLQQYTAIHHNILSRHLTHEHVRIH